MRVLKKQRKKLIYGVIILFLVQLIYQITNTNENRFIVWENSKILKKGVIDCVFAYSINENPVILYFKVSNDKKNPVATVIFVSEICNVSFGPNDYEFLDSTRKNFKYCLFKIPVAGNYSVMIDNNTKKSDFMFQIVKPIKKLEHHSTLMCYGEDYYSRFCLAENICWSENKFQFFSNMTISFNKSIMYPGSRPIPFDYPSCRTVIKFISKNSPMNLSQLISDTSLITCRWYGMQHFWHVLFDYTIPLFWTIKKASNTSIRHRIFFIDQNDSMKGTLFTDMFTDEKIQNLRIDLSNLTTCWKRVVIGFPKSENPVNPQKWKTVLDIPYHYPSEAYDGFRQMAIQHYIGKDLQPKQCIPSKDHPDIVFVFRISKKRHIINRDELVNSTKNFCPYCNIRTTFTTNMSIGDQVSFFCNSSIIIGLHGGGLSHMLWMETNKSALIELLPYKYTCRNWYEQIANGCGVKYFSWVNNHSDATYRGRNGNNHYDECIDGELPCLSDKCHDIFRDQLTSVNIDEFLIIFKEALSFVTK